jgi:hypothetical protein
MQHTARIKLITIFCTNELEDRLSRVLRLLAGIHGYMTTRSSGRGLQDARRRDAVDGGSVRIELLVQSGHEGRVMDVLAEKFSDEPLAAWAQDVDAFNAQAVRFLTV